MSIVVAHGAPFTRLIFLVLDDLTSERVTPAPEGGNVASWMLKFSGLALAFWVLLERREGWNRCSPAAITGSPVSR